MKIHLIKRSTIEKFVKANVQSRSSFEDWIEKIKNADWKLPADMQSTFGNADLLGDGSNRIVFNIGGNNFRMICKYFFGVKQVHLFVCWIGSHADYDKICKKNEQYTVNIY
jgi:mRNA interferase HigB